MQSKTVLDRRNLEKHIFTFIFMRHILYYLTAAWSCCFIAQLAGMTYDHKNR